MLFNRAQNSRIIKWIKMTAKRVYGKWFKLGRCNQRIQHIPKFNQIQSSKWLLKVHIFAMTFTRQKSAMHTYTRTWDCIKSIEWDGKQFKRENISLIWMSGMDASIWWIEGVDAMLNKAHIVFWMSGISSMFWLFKKISTKLLISYGVWGCEQLLIRAASSHLWYVCVCVFI